MADWDSAQYLKFAAERSRPARDLMARIPGRAPGVIYDLGCGAGNVTRLLAERWPEAEICGVDSSPEMLAKARAGEDLGILWAEGDIADWRPSRSPDLLFSNAALQWLDDHAALFPRLMGLLEPGAVLAVQMPHSHRQPSHVLMAETVDDGPWRERLRGVLRHWPVAEPEAYYDWLAPLAVRVEVWETIYCQVMEGDNPVVEFIKSTALRPLLQALEGEEREAFLAAYAARIREAYRPQADGRTLFPFHRLFIVATR